MGFPWTLQRYIFREMARTFLLTAAALTGILGLGGGVLQMIKLGEVTTGQLLRMLGLVLPVAAALTLPIAALFSASATYGRLSADNEFVACRSGGINLHVLFLPALVLSLASSLVTFVFLNFLIPGMVRNLEEFVSTDMATFVRQRLNRPKGMTLNSQYRISADDTVVESADPGSVTLHRIAFVEVDGEEWIRYGTAQEVGLHFERVEERVRASGYLRGLSFYDRQAGRFADVAEQIIPVNELPTVVPMEIKFLTLADLYRYGAAPGSWHQVAAALDQVREGLGRRWTYDALLDDWKSDGRVVLDGEAVRYTVIAAEAARLPRDAGLQLTDVTVEEEGAASRRTYAAKNAALDIARGDRLESAGLRLELRDARMRDGQSNAAQAKVTLGPVPLEASLLERVVSLGEDALLAATAADAGDPLSDKVYKAREILGAVTRKIRATISERFAFSLAVITLVILGAALGIVYRGAHFVVAFGISFVPALAVIITIVTGRQMACNATTHVLGLALSWAGLGAVAALDWWTLTRLLRR